MVFWHTVKLVWRRIGMAFIVFYMTLLQSTCNSASNDVWVVMFRFLVSDPFDTKLFTKYGSFSVATAYYMSNEHPACAASSRRVQDWGNNSGLRDWVSSPSLVVSDPIWFHEWSCPDQITIPVIQLAIWICVGSVFSSKNWLFSQQYCHIYSLQTTRKRSVWCWQLVNILWSQPHTHTCETRHVQTLLFDEQHGVIA